MQKLIPSYLASMIFMFVLDLIWLSQLAQPIYNRGIGHLMAATPNLLYAALFYCVFVFGLMCYAVKPNVQSRGIKSTFLSGAMFGFFIYASYDLTNLALLKDWPLGMSIIDITWGTLLSGTSASAGKIVYDWLKKA
jgi:uncharacterized membrane protein